MPEDKDIVPVEGQLVPSEAASELAESQLEQAFQQMSQFVVMAVQSLMLQNARDAETAARGAQALFLAIQSHADTHAVRLLRLFVEIVSLFAPMTRAICFQMEGRYLKAHDEVLKGLATVEQAATSLSEYMQLPDFWEEIVQVYQPMLSILPLMFKGTGAYIRAETVGYQGRVREYTRLLGEAVAEYRKVDGLSPSRDPTYLALAANCTAMADRLDTRIEVFSSQPEQRYLNPTGEKIFLIHGHAEAKWRELRDLLERRLKLKTVVLKEEPGAGETLIQKFEEYADDCRYAFALLTADDFVQKEGRTYFQARPNVLFEIGWFYGHFGRKSVCIVKRRGTQLPSDLDGILTIDFQEQVEEGFTRIEDELRRAGLVGMKKRKLAVGK